MICKDRQGNVVIEENSQDNLLKKLYGSTLGRSFLRVLTMPVWSKLVGELLSTRLSVNIIKPFLKANNIDMSDYNNRTYVSYNDFFTREVKAEARPIDYNRNNLISPADGRVQAFEIDENSVFEIKDSKYSVESILGSKSAAKRYMGGYCVIVRLCVDNYHRYHYIDNGVLGKSKFIPGVLHTVNPEALNQYNIYKKNSRACTILHTENFGDVMQVEVGALMVGKIINHHKTGEIFKRGDEKGKFEFGGSTVVLFIQKDKAIIDKDIMDNTKSGYETAIKMGERIGTKL